MSMRDLFRAERLEGRWLLTAAVAKAAEQALSMSPAVVMGGPGADGDAAAAAQSPLLALATAASIDAPQLQVNAGTLYLTDAVDGAASDAKTLTLTNVGGGQLIIQPGGISFVGPDASQFRADVGSYGILLEAGESTKLRIRMNAARVGVSTATLQIASNDPSGTITQVAIRGLGTAGTATGPTPQQVLDVYGIPMQIARPSPTVGGEIAGEQTLQLLAKAGPGPVTIRPLGLTAKGSIGGDVMYLGWYSPGVNGAAPVTTPQLTVTSVDAVSVAPFGWGSGQFDPGGGAFGVYAEWPGLLNRQSWSQDTLNTWEPNLYARRKVRFYALKGADGSIVPNSYVVTAESSNGTATTLGGDDREQRPARGAAGGLAGQRRRHAGERRRPGQRRGRHVGRRRRGGRHRRDGRRIPLRLPHAPWRRRDRRPRRDARQHQLARAGRRDGARIARPERPPGRHGSDAGRRQHLPVPHRHRWRHHRRRDDRGRRALWVKIVRAGSTITGYRSKDGKTWTKQGSATIAMGTDVLVGLAVTSHDNSKLAGATFDNLAVTPTLATNRPPVAPLLSAPNPAAGVVTIRADGGDASVSARLLIDGAPVGAALSGAGPYSFTWDSRTVADGRTRSASRRPTASATSSPPTPPSPSATPTCRRRSASWASRKGPT